MPVRWYERTGGEGTRQRDGWRPHWLLALGLLLLIALATRTYWLPLFSRVLIATQEAVPADAIVVLAGGSGSREELAVALFKKGYAPSLVSSGEAPHLPGFQPSLAELSADYMVSLGAPRDAMILLPDTTSTRDEALACLQLAREGGLTSLLVITDSYHTRRARLTFGKVFDGSGVRVILVGAEPDWFSANTWWTQERSLLAVLDEYAELVLYVVKGWV
jgi:uncharacterized SAM-binding protein YcdF (DUF218 family)